MTTSKALFVAMLLTFGCLFAPASPVDWPTLGFRPVVTNGFTQPTLVTHAGDGSQRLFVVEQPGRIKVVPQGSASSEPFLDITDRVLNAGAEQGLLGLAFPPGFATNEHFYVDYTSQPDGAVVVSRFQMATNLTDADPSTEEVVLVIPKPYPNHNGGQLAFGPDGYLYIGVGDGGSEGDPLRYGQNTRVLLGKLLRIDVEHGGATYVVPSDNPFIGNTNYAPEIWSLGLRNPWRFSFDRLNGNLFIGDVGQGAVEEIDYQAAGSAGGQNYGWSIMEGPNNFNVPSGFTNWSLLSQPVSYYGHASLPTDLNAAVVGGFVYRGPSQPRLDGIYFYGDFVAGWIWGLAQQGTNWQNFVVAHTNFGISTFGEDDLGNLYVSDYFRGLVYQIQDTRQVWTPVFSLTNGTFGSNIQVSVTCATPAVSIHYTTNGLAPTEFDPVVDSGGTLTVSANSTNQARAYRADLSPSPIATAIFHFVTAKPVFNPPSGALTNPSSISISSSTPDATIFYSTNGTATTNSSLYLGPIRLSPPGRFSAMAVKRGYSNSVVVSASYSFAQTPPPTFDPPSGPVTNGTAVSISITTPGVTVRYTLDGSAPGTNSPLYTGPITADWPATVMARTFSPGWAPSSVSSAYYGLLSQEQSVVTTLAGGLASGYSNGPAALALFSSPSGLCLDAAGNLFVADSGNNVIRKISATGEVTTVAGTGLAGAQDGASADAQFNGPTGVCVDSSGNLFVADAGNCYRVRKIDTNGVVSTLASLQSCLLGNTMWQIEVGPDGNLYVGSYGMVVKVQPDGAYSTLIDAGSLSGSGWDFRIGLALDAMTNVYAASQSRVWLVAQDGSEQLVAGSSDFYGGFGYSDGPGLRALFQGPQDTTLDGQTNVYVSDETRIRRISPSGWVSTVAGNGNSGSIINGRGAVAQFGVTAAICRDARGNLYVADAGNNCVRKVSPDTMGIGIADDWQMKYFGRIGIDPNGDPDHDGASNFAEFWAGTDPLDANSALRIKSTLPIDAGQIQIRWQSVAGKTYAIMYSSDLQTWQTLGEPLVGYGSIMSVIDTITPVQQGPRYYRVAVVGF